MADGSIKSMDPAKACDMLQTLPLCVISLNPETFHPIAINDMFERCIGPLYKFEGADFSFAATDEKQSDARARFRAAMEQAVQNHHRTNHHQNDSPNHNTSERIRVRDIEITTLSEENSGFPIRRFFDWFIQISGNENDDGTPPLLLLLGDPCTDQDVTQRAKDSELIDFFQNAPIALHWLSGEGKVLWANQTELNVLGYTAEEYIGQDIMKFCPDEQALVLEIFKQLGGGNSIKDVPVRFRTKDGKIVNLLIDSNVRYEKDGSFGHTRCFIRDDTGRKIRESRATLMLEETRRSLTMLDNFIARSLHHLRTPLHVTQAMVDSIGAYFKTLKAKNAIIDDETKECIDMLRLADDQISQSVDFLEDISDLAKFDQGAVLHVKPEVFDLEQFGREMLKLVPLTSKKNVTAVLDLRQQEEMQGEGPALAVSDPKVLRRLLRHLLNNAMDVTLTGTVSLGIGYKNKRLTFSVTDTGSGLEMPENAAEGDLPVIFQRYHKELLPEDTAQPDLTIATSIREKIEKGINTHKKTGMGIGLSLTYHLVQALGGEIRCTSIMGVGTKFQFSLPRTVSVNTTIPPKSSLVAMQLTRRPRALKARQGVPPMLSNGSKLSEDMPMLEESNKDVGKIRRSCTTTIVTSNTEDAMSTFDESTLSGESGMGNNKRARTHDIPSSFDMPMHIVPNVPASALASQGVKSQNPPSILVVEDTVICSRMLCRILAQFKCATKVAENGKVAVDILTQATPGTYDLILMDLRMPVLDGLEATAFIKNQLHISTPIVALTGDENAQTREEAMKIGFDAFYGKPMKRDDLKSVIKQFTGYDVQ
jgi:PAS domain S-box-containing protein